MVLTRIQAKRLSLFDVKPCKCWSSTFGNGTPQIFRKKAEYRLSMSLQKLWCILPNPFHFLILLSWESIKSGSACFVCVWTLSRELIWVFSHHHDSQPFASITVRFFQTFFHNFSVTVLDTVSSVSTISTSQNPLAKLSMLAEKFVPQGQSVVSASVDQQDYFSAYTLIFRKRSRK